MDTPAESSGILGHLEQHLGSVQKVESGKSEHGNRGYDLTFFHQDQPPISTVVTNGLRFQSITAVIPEELACTLWDGQEHIAHFLTDTTASMLLEMGRGLDFGMVVENDEPILQGTAICGVLAHPSPYFDSGFNVFPTSEEATLQIVSLLPVTSGEAALSQQEGPEALFEVP
ncbi:suppressor of fused domain protein [Parasphingorhabdus pacifica]